jgi:N-acetylglucosaminyldiphosphoundecaprenol N-acetyl-beta-D-mannosaminyltransferase
MPRQEIWITQNFEALPDCAIFSVGAAFDYEAGVQKSAPRWMGKAGVEWLYRLAADPKRLFRRYCVEPWSLLDLIYDDLPPPPNAASPPSARALSSPSAAKRTRDGDNTPGMSPSLLNVPLRERGPRSA